MSIRNISNKSLRYGDLVYITVDRRNSSSPGYFSADNIAAAASRLCSDDNFSNLKVIFSTEGRHYPTDFFSSCIFRIDEGVGYEAAGEKVRYGASIRLILQRSNEYMVSMRNYTSIATLSDRVIALKEFKAQSRQFVNTNFVVRQSFKNRSEGELVYYEDLIHLVDVHGDFLSSDKLGNKEQALITHPRNKLSFRICPYLSFDEIKEGTLKAGDVIRLYHRQDDAYLTSLITEEKHCHSEKKVYVNCLGDAIDKLLLTRDFRRSADEGIRPSCDVNVKIGMKNSHRSRVGFCDISQMWSVELADPMKPPDSNGVVCRFTSVRLKHVVTGVYLAIYMGEDEAVVVNSTHEQSAESVFSVDYAGPQFHLETADSAHPIQVGNNICVLHKDRFLATVSSLGDFDFLGSDFGFSNMTTNQEGEGGEGEQSMTNLTASKGRIDKDVFIFSAVDSGDVELVRLVLSSQDALLRQVELWRKEEFRKTRTHASSEHGMRCAANILHVLLHRFPKQRASETDTFTSFYQCTLMDLGFIELCLWIANVADKICSKSFGKNALASNLVKAAYDLLEKIIHGNPHSTKIIAKVHGVKQMVNHLSQGFHPPLEALIETSLLVDSSESDWREQYLSISKSDVHVILNKVHDSLKKGSVKGQNLYKYLTAFCRVNDSIGTGFENAAAPYLRVQQDWICELLLGSADKDPGRSAMTYRTRRVNNRLFVNTSILGQQRPRYTPNTSDRLLGKSMEEHKLEVEYRNEIQYPQETNIVLPSNVKLEATDVEAMVHWLISQDAWYNNDKENCLQRLKKHRLATKDGTYGWLEDYVSRHVKPIEALDQDEIQFYSLTLNLLAAICDGRNMLTQSMVRRLIPVDDILLALSVADTLKYDYNIRAAYANVLRSCYINSALLQPLPASISTDTLCWRKDFKSPVRDDTWEDVYADEMGKVLSLATQEDEFELQCTKDSSPEEIEAEFQACVGYAKFHKEKGLPFSLPPPFYPPADAENVKRHFMLTHQLERRYEMSQRNIKTYKQRDDLERIVMDFFAGDTQLLILEEVMDTFHRSSTDGEKKHIVKADKMKHREEEISAVMNYAYSMLLLVDNLLKRRFFEEEICIFPKFCGPIPIITPLSTFSTVDDKLDKTAHSDSSGTYFYRTSGSQEKAGGGNDIYSIPEGYKLIYRDHVVDDVLVNTITWLCKEGKVMTNTVQQICLAAFHNFKLVPRRELDQPTYAKASALHKADDIVNEYFNNIYGNKAMSNPLFKQLLDIKHVGCNIINLCVDIIECKIVDSVWSHFHPMFVTYLEKMRRNYDSNGNVHTTNTSDKHTNNFISVGVITNVQNKNNGKTSGLKNELNKSKEFVEILKVDSDSVLRTNEAGRSLIQLFKDGLDTVGSRSFELMNLIYFDNKKLREETLALVCRFHSLRKEIGSKLIQSHLAVLSESNGLQMDVDIINKSRAAMIPLMMRFPDPILVTGTGGRVLNRWTLHDLRKLQRIFKRKPSSSATKTAAQSRPGLLDLWNAECDGGTERKYAAKILRNWDALPLPPSTLNVVIDVSEHEDEETPSHKGNLSEAKLEELRRIRETIVEMGIHDIVRDFLHDRLVISCRTRKEYCERFHVEQIRVFDLSFQFLLLFGKASNENIQMLATENTFKMLFQHKYFSAKASTLLCNILSQCDDVDQYVTDTIIDKLIYDVESFVTESDYHSASYAIIILKHCMTSKGISRNSAILRAAQILSMHLSQQRTYLSQLLCKNDSNDFDANHLCKLYNAETGRVTGMKSLSFLAHQEILVKQQYPTYQNMCKQWKVLRQTSLLRAHLEFVDLIATCVMAEGTDVRPLGRQLFPDLDYLFNVLSIDKLEVRTPYLRLLRGFKLSSTVGSEDSETTIYDAYSANCFALFKSFCLDMRLYECSIASGDKRDRALLHHAFLLEVCLRSFPNLGRQCVAYK